MLARQFLASSGGSQEWARSPFVPSPRDGSRDSTRCFAGTRYEAPHPDSALACLAATRPPDESKAPEFPRDKATSAIEGPAASRSPRRRRKSGLFSPEFAFASKTVT